MRTPESCAVCRRGLVPEREFAGMTRRQRLDLRGSGRVSHRGRGMCSTCYDKARAAGTLIDHERRTVSAADVADEWAMHADRHRTQAENARLLAPRLGMTPAALTKAVQRLEAAA